VGFLLEQPDKKHKQKPVHNRKIIVPYIFVTNQKLIQVILRYPFYKTTFWTFSKKMKPYPKSFRIDKISNCIILSYVSRIVTVLNPV